ncbi:glycoside hydrolase family protein [Ferruginibacter albus]|uniref:hypothetical protein n=1 Tax=Ferruginibacter albus TaxID=2875540 RepID=UPI001CC45577|nr:hypothetical protein [Ferruginibacter albus]UAY53606.1 hypothetical protein K9M53_08045 [Ferruginibacter albus]
MRITKSYFLFIAAILFTNTLLAQVAQQELATVNKMPDLPKPFKIIDYKKLALDFDKTVFDFNAKEKFYPLVWIDSSNKNFPQPVVGMYTAIGDARQGPQNNKGMFHEGLATMGATLGATLVGIDKTKGINYAQMLINYFNKETGWNIMMNNTCPEVALLGGGYGRDWWYDVYPNMLFYSIYDKYPNVAHYDEIAKSIAEKFYAADSILNGDYNYSFFDYGKMQPMKNWICAQPDVAAGHAWVLYMAYKKFGDKRYLKGAINALHALQSQKINPIYEIIMPFGAYLSARINAELNENFDTHKMLDWSFNGTAVCREGWGVLTGNWNGFDIDGMVGSTVDRGGYGFLMNTYDMAMPIVPLVRYDQSYATAIGKWMLNAANVCKLFYPQYMPADHQTAFKESPVTKGVIAYEGIIKKSDYKGFENMAAPVAQGDGPLWVPGKNPTESQFSVYGSAHVGIFGSIIRKTNVEGILQLNLLATDFFHDEAYPTYLYYNPYPAAKTITVRIDGTSAKDIYNTVKGKFVARKITKTCSITVPAKSSAVLVFAPAAGKQTMQGNKLLVNNIVVDYHYKK